MYYGMFNSSVVGVLLRVDLSETDLFNLLLWPVGDASKRDCWISDCRADYLRSIGIPTISDQSACRLQLHEISRLRSALTATQPGMQHAHHPRIIEEGLDHNSRRTSIVANAIEMCLLNRSRIAGCPTLYLTPSQVGQARSKAGIGVAGIL